MNKQLMFAVNMLFNYYNHNCGKILKSDWLSLNVLVSAPIGQYASCLCNWTVQATSHVHLKKTLGISCVFYFQED